MKPAGCKSLSPNIVWNHISEDTSLLRNLKRKLNQLPLRSASVKYMPKTKGYFFRLSLKENLSIAISQYEEDLEKGAYVNVSLDGEVVLQDFMIFDNIIKAVRSFYNEIGYE